MVTEDVSPDARFALGLVYDRVLDVAKLYGMIQPNEDTTKAVRAVFFVDPKGIMAPGVSMPIE